MLLSGDTPLVLEFPGEPPCDMPAAPTGRVVSASWPHAGSFLARARFGENVYLSLRPWRGALVLAVLDSQPKERVNLNDHHLGFDRLFLLNYSGDYARVRPGGMHDPRRSVRIPTELAEDAWDVLVAIALLKATQWGFRKPVESKLKPGAPTRT